MTLNHRCTRSALLLLTGLLTACAASVGPPLTPVADPDQALAMQHRLRAQNLDVGRITVARLRVDGEPLEVTSLLPVIVAEARINNGSAYTIFRFSADREHLVLFTRDPATGEGVRLDLARAEWRQGRVIQFPVLDASGALRPRAIELHRLIER